MKRKIQILLVSISFLFATTSCEILEGLGGENLDELTLTEVVSGLKKALVIGTDSSTNALSIANGYYGDNFVKIPLPDEAEQVRQQIILLSSVAGLDGIFDVDQEFENVVKSINMAAGEAAKDAKPIFVSAIEGISLEEGWDILNGINPSSTLKADGFDSTAATGYFKANTQSSLQALFAPKIDLQLDKDLGLGFSANEAWSTLRSAINTTLNKIEGNFLLNIAYQNSGYTVNRITSTSLGDFATEKALDGLFYKVGLEEKKIRNNPYDWADDIIQKVFGSIYQE